MRHKQGGARPDTHVSVARCSAACQDRRDMHKAAQVDIHDLMSWYSPLLGLCIHGRHSCVHAMMLAALQTYARLMCNAKHSSSASPVTGSAGYCSQTGCRAVSLTLSCNEQLKRGTGPQPNPSTLHNTLACGWRVRSMHCCCPGAQLVGQAGQAVDGQLPGIAAHQLPGQPELAPQDHDGHQTPLAGAPGRAPSPAWGA